MRSLLTKVFGDVDQREYKRLIPLVDDINFLEDEMSDLTDEELRDVVV